ncbi:hypothetical protein [Haloechinothrix halophila]|uniref:hypothetical protein n=1 Tax=Haloechinothrix halophila TaxID=1069073 RepID=UPI00041C47BA|nr:hypothetical protein [Haloechinothrix halophila]
MACTGCVEELDHCHGALIEHHDGDVECTEPGCTALDPARHDISQRCDDVISCECVADRHLVVAA